MNEFPFRLTRVEPGRGYSDEKPLPDASLRFDHDLIDVEGGIAIRQRVTMEGQAANNLFATFGKGIILDLPAALARFAATAEQASAPA
ncbi:MAG: hypothetical protein H0U07_09575 [Actinobacteria bacterium]|nr:hypothetical protein [Actinomycetota bacterium]